MLGIFLISLVLRFWGLERFNTLVFDEVYYAKYANYYLIGKDFFNSHPPLSQYIIAIGIWLGSFLPSTADTTNNLTESLRSTFSYRWINALTGSFIPLVVGAIAYQLNHRPSFSLLATLLTALDGLFLVESRYALNNIYLVLFGLLGHLCFLVAGESKKVNLTWLLISGVCFGSSVAVKWNGLGFLFGLWIVIAIAAIKNYFSNKKQDDFLWQKFTRIKPFRFNDFVKVREKV
jgi:dolichyl-phosphate-mannose--protein O-mannosyl transferase